MFLINEVVDIRGYWKNVAVIEEKINYDRIIVDCENLVEHTILRAWYYDSLIVGVLIAARDLANVPFADRRWWYHVVQVAYVVWIQNTDPGDWIRFEGWFTGQGSNNPGDSGPTNIAKVFKLTLGLLKFKSIVPSGDDWHNRKTIRNATRCSAKVARHWRIFAIFSPGIYCIIF